MAAPLGLGLGPAQGAGAGVDALQQLLATRFQEALAVKQQAMESQRLQAELQAQSDAKTRQAALDANASDMQQFDLLNRQPFASQPHEAGAMLDTGTAIPQPATVSIRPGPGGVAPIKVRLQSAEAYANQQRQSKFADVMTTPQKLGEGDKLVIPGSGQVLASGEPKPPTGDQETAKYLAVQQKVALKQPLTPDERAFATAYEKNKSLVPAVTNALAAPTRDQQRTDRSYTQATTQLANLRKPVSDALDKFGGLTDLLDARTPAADALVAPKLLTVMVGGQGSGVRINNAEIDRISGGQTNWEALQKAANAWSLDPTHVQITDAQRAQMRAVATLAESKVRAKLDAIDAANAKLADPDLTVEDHRKILGDLQKTLDQISGTSAGSGDKNSAGGSAKVVRDPVTGQLTIIRKPGGGG